MTANEIGYDFNKIRTAVIFKHNRMISLMSLILFPTFFLIFLSFLIIYLLRVPMEINDITRNFGEPEYHRFFSIFLPVSGGLSFMQIILFLFIDKALPKTTIYLKTDVDNNLSVYAVDKKKHVYVDNLQTVTFYTAHGDYLRSEDKYLIYKTMNDLVFWHGLDSIKDFKIRKKLRITKISYLDPSSGNSEKKTYSIKFDDSGNISHYRETIVSKSFGNQQLKAHNLYLIDNINLNTRIPYHPTIVREANLL
ncbi:MAG: hypothetical protein JXB20_04670 [Bacilli bacterium]|nr:hypothetical protein [Bacilli bacterium]MBN2696248.1 hypothetical protein [Bacilli bacterium]